MEKYNFRMLALARETRGLTQMELARKIGMAQSNYSKIEKGLIPLVKEHVDRITPVLKFTEQFFTKEYPLNHISQFYYRKRLSMKVKELALLESKFKLFAMSLDAMLTSVSIPEFTLPMMEVTKTNTPQHIAAQVRAFLRVPAGPIPALVNLLESAGIIVYFIKDVPDKFDGMTMITNDGHTIIFINNSIPNDRKRYTIAHELGHVIMHLRNADNLENEEMDREADAFASEFLMPLVDCRADIENLRFRDLGTLKAYWKVSKAAIIRKAKDNGMDASKYQTFMIELSRAGERKVEEGFVEIDPPVLIEKIVHAHLTTLKYSAEELLDILALNESDFYYLFAKQKDDLRKPILKIVA